MRFLTLEDCSDSKLHCIYHDPERTVTVLHPRSACSLQIYAPQEDHHAAIGAFYTSRPNSAHAWWQQLLGIVENQLLSLAAGVAQEVGEDANAAREVNRDVLKWHLMNVRAIIPAHEVLDEEELLQTIQPLPSPWSWPSNTFYRETRRGYVEYLSEPLIAELVTRGLLLANDAGIRWTHLDQYVLVKTEEEVLGRANQPRYEKLDPRAFRRARITRPDMKGELSELGEKVATPIVELGSPLVGPGGKKVRLCSKKVCVCFDGGGAVIKEEDVEDNEGKTVGKAREVARQKARSQIC